VGGVGRLCGLYDLDVVSRVFVGLVGGWWEGWRWEGSVVGSGGVVEDGLREKVVHLLCSSMSFLFSWDYVVGWFTELGLGFVSERHVWVGVGLAYVSKSADDRILEEKTEMLFGHWQEGGEERRGGGGRGMGCSFSVS